ncbi:MAG: NAD(P)H dehydrogenase assembly family protein [Cyanobium sp.]
MNGALNSPADGDGPQGERGDGLQGGTAFEPAELFGVGRAVRVNGSLPFLKTADPMPMLRPPDLIDPGESGVVVEVRALGMRAVRFRRGTFLLQASALSLATPEGPDPG